MQTVCGFLHQQRRNKVQSFGNKAFNEKEDILFDRVPNFEGHKNLKHVESQFLGYERMG